MVQKQGKKRWDGSGQNPGRGEASRNEKRNQRTPRDNPHLPTIPSRSPQMERGIPEGPQWTGKPPRKLRKQASTQKDPEHAPLALESKDIESSHHISLSIYHYGLTFGPLRPRPRSGSPARPGRPPWTKSPSASALHTARCPRCSGGVPPGNSSCQAVERGSWCRWVDGWMDGWMGGEYGVVEGFGG